jgi:hypothetical protein
MRARRPGGRLPGGWWFATETEAAFAESDVYRPDVAGWRRERLPELPSTVPSHVRPDWVCEILSSILPRRRYRSIDDRRRLSYLPAGGYLDSRIVTAVPNASSILPLVLSMLRLSRCARMIVF